MMIAKNDEERRSRLWRMTTVVSSALIIVIAVYLLMKLFFTNPLEGNWRDEDGSLGITIRSNGEMVVKVPDLAEDEEVEVEMSYTLDKDAKTITIHSEEETLKEVSDQADGRYTLEMLENAVSPIETAFDYSMDGDQLTLTEREYGEQMIFLKE